MWYTQNMWELFGCYSWYILYWIWQLDTVLYQAICCKPIVCLPIFIESSYMKKKQVVGMILMCFYTDHVLFPLEIPLKSCSSTIKRFIFHFELWSWNFFFIFLGSIQVVICVPTNKKIWNFLVWNYYLYLAHLVEDFYRYFALWL